MGVFILGNRETAFLKRPDHILLRHSPFLRQVIHADGKPFSALISAHERLDGFEEGRQFVLLGERLPFVRLSALIGGIGVQIALGVAEPAKPVVRTRLFACDVLRLILGRWRMRPLEFGLEFRAELVHFGAGRRRRGVLQRPFALRGVPGQAGERQRDCRAAFENG